ncbi:GNAT family N-acetyltransferase [Microbacterium sp. ZW T5_56]|uniref:GNAT family N-acetyltransferase n=1 Tax=Microbacterium sp. ZW T5_56 TaxID=3378081 RepID=UPI003854C31D
MTSQEEIIVGRWDRGSVAQSRALSVLLGDYHRQTEAEKGAAVDVIGALPARYRLEVVDPGTAFADDVVLVAQQGDQPAGCVVITDAGDRQLEIKRLWTAPEFRGRRVASRLLAAVEAHAEVVGADSIRLSVWEWRVDAIGLYRKLGFIEASSWETRDGLICMTRAV